MEKTMVFIDGSNFYYACKDVGISPRIDFYKLGQMLTSKDRKLVRVYYYNAPREKIDGDAESSSKFAAQQRFFNAIQKMSYVSLVLGRLEKRKRKCRSCGKETEYYTEKATDINIAVDMVTVAFKENCNTIILISADGDFTKAVDAVKEKGLNLEVACFKGHSSRHLNNKADKVHWLDDFDLSTCDKNCNRKK